ncbi:Pollen receptor-like kinase 1 [Camellia lanceoleosa]|uniref:Pollen receptor-like kinase 1 n=1 Tax=Camellia lanceoleosa TaxID=1840588 RepID=A0ACC0GFI6_9ERIC|nr:Pollen receptor-like kinase 1 [Camellia lanceoleosa]
MLERWLILNPPTAAVAMDGGDEVACPAAVMRVPVAVVVAEQQQYGSSPDMSVNGNSKKDDQHGKFPFVRDDRQRFDLQDLLRTSVEVLGSGNFGSSYKAVLMDGHAVVVKRFKHMLRGSDRGDLSY